MIHDPEVVNPLDSLVPTNAESHGMAENKG